MSKLILGVFVITMFLSCDNPKRAILGKWMMHQVIQDGKEVTQEHNPKNERYIILDENETFVSGGAPFGENAGKYDFNPREKTLFIDSDGGVDDDCHWKVSFEDRKMIWQGVGTEWAEGFKIIYIRPKRDS